MTKRKKHSEKKFYGTANIGEKGQVVIPKEARQNLNLKKGDRLLVFGVNEGMITFVKLSQIEKIASHLSKKLEIIDEIVRKSK